MHEQSERLGKLSWDERTKSRTTCSVPEREVRRVPAKDSGVYLFMYDRELARALTWNTRAWRAASDHDWSVKSRYSTCVRCKYRFIAARALSDPHSAPLRWSLWPSESYSRQSRIVRCAKPTRLFALPNLCAQKRCIQLMRIGRFDLAWCKHESRDQGFCCLIDGG